MILYYKGFFTAFILFTHTSTLFNKTIAVINELLGIESGYICTTNL